MKKKTWIQGIAAVMTLVAVGAGISVLMSSRASALEIGKPAPSFTGKGSDGKDYNLSDYRGKYVVLEWLNHGCPYVAKHYDSGNMQGLQKKYTEKETIWLSVISSAPGKQGYSTPEEANADVKKHNASPTAVILDPEGKIGRAYDAKTTPHMFVINPKGDLIYAGAIDSKRSTDQKDIPKSVNYVSQALDEAMAGKPVTTASTQAYGCSVKY